MTKWVGVTAMLLFLDGFIVVWIARCVKQGSTAWFPGVFRRETSPMLYRVQVGVLSAMAMLAICFTIAVSVLLLPM